MDWDCSSQLNPSWRGGGSPPRGGANRSGYWKFIGKQAANNQQPATRTGKSKDQRMPPGPATALIFPLLRRKFTRTKPPGDRRNKGVGGGNW